MRAARFPRRRDELGRHALPGKRSPIRR